jgi:hypothetical protein
LKQLWIGLVEARPLEGCTILQVSKGAFINIVTWAEDEGEFRRKAELVLREENLLVVDVENPEPVQSRRNSTSFDEEMENIIFRAENNPNAIICGTFHLYRNDDA